MARVRAAGWAGGAVLALGLVAQPPSTARAGDEPSLTLPGSTLTAVTVDLDGDAAREVVRLRGDGRASSVLEVWAHDGATWSMTDAVATEPIRIADGSPADSQGTGLLRWTHAGREELVLVTAATDVSGSTFPSPCCLAFSMLERAGRGYRIVGVPGGGGSGDAALVVDLDGDGTDEIVTQRTVVLSDTDPGTLELDVHRWSDGRFETMQRLSSPVAYGVLPAETDGRPGDELLLYGTLDGSLVRYAFRDGAVVAEETPLGTADRGDAFLGGVADGLIVVNGSQTASVVRWPADGPADVVAEVPFPEGSGAQVIGTGADALAFVATGVWTNGPPLPSGDLFTLGGRALGSVAPSEATERVWPLIAGDLSGVISTTRSVWPYGGPVPMRGGDAYLLGGTLVTPHGEDGFETRWFGPLAGSVPVGRAGRDDAWLVLQEGVGAFSTNGALASLWPYGYMGEQGRLSIVADGALAADASTEFSVRMEHAIQLADGTLYADAGGFDLVIDAPPGTTVVSYDRGVGRTHDVHDDGAVITIRPPRNAEDDHDEVFSWEGVVILPDGRTAPIAYAGTFVRESLLSTIGAHEPLELRAGISGTTRPGASVLVDGRPVTVDADGHFTTEVNAPPWPRTVVVTAVDPLGNETTTTVEVIGLVDYRGLPWALIFAAATVAAGLFLFLRTPRQPHAPTPVPAEGTLEEIDGD